ncbi:myb/SANT-like DNA-binding domain-containing protein 4 [Clytia hemisphaerica]|uniref:myb/SANT-like DNA-binding domain-containing protein 4 n=1 Tax=Clytia hemisphaerica TaxID=252671 RepID=UPI0034D596C7
MSGKRPRKTNFTADEIRIILEEYEASQSTIEGKFSPSITNAAKQALWENITLKVNALGVANRSTKDIETKWKNLKSDAKITHNEYKRYVNGTGGGPPTKPPTEAQHKVISLFEGRPSFEGLDGFSSSSFIDDTDIQSNSISLDQPGPSSQNKLIENDVMLFSPPSKTSQNPSTINKKKNILQSKKPSKKNKTSTLTIQRQCLIKELNIQKAKLKFQRLKNKEVLLKIKNERRHAELLDLQKEKAALELTLMNTNFVYVDPTEENINNNEQ